MEENPKAFLYTIIGFITVLICLIYFCKNEKVKSADELYKEKVWSGTYSATVTGTHEYRKDINGNVYVKNDTITIIK